MGAVLVGLLNIRNTEWQAEYQQRLPEVLKKHGGRIIAAAPPMHFEGTTRPDRLVIFEFPDLEAAQNWYRDPDHAPLVTLRQTGADLELYGIEVSK